MMPADYHVRERESAPTSTEWGPRRSSVVGMVTVVLLTVAVVVALLVWLATI